MENTNKTVSPQGNFDANGVFNNFKALLIASWEFFMKNAGNILLAFAVPVIIGTLLAYLALPLLAGAFLAAGPVGFAIFGVITMLLMLVFQVYAYAASLRVVTLSDRSEKIEIAGVLKYVNANLVNYIKLMIRVFIYTGAWIPLVVAIAGAVLAPIAPELGAMLLMAFPIVALVVLIVFFKKMINSSLAAIFFFSSDNPQPEEALKNSLTLAEGRSWILFWNYVLIGLVTGIVSGLLTSVVSPLTTGVHVSLASSIASAVVGGFTVVFQFHMKKALEKEGARK